MKRLKVFLKPLITFVLCVFLIFSFYEFIDSSNQLNTERTFEHLKDVGKEGANNYNQRFNHLKDSILNTCSIIGNHLDSQEDVKNILTGMKKEKYLFDRVWYIDQNKKFYNYKEDVETYFSEDYIQDIFKGKSGITDVLVSPYNQKKVIVVYAPVEKENQVIGGMAGIVEINDEENDDIYNDVFNNQSYTFATSSQGQMISRIRNDNVLYYGENYFQFLQNEVQFQSNSYPQVLQDIQKGDSGFLSYSYNGVERMVYYTPVQINDWYIFTIISGDIVESQNSRLSYITFWLIIKITLAFAIMMLIVVRYFRKINRLNKEKNLQLQTSNQKIEMILQQISDRIFEYDIENDSLTLDRWNDYPKIILNHFLSNLHNYSFVSKEHENILIEKFQRIRQGEQKVVFDAKLPYISKDEDTWFHISMIYVEENKKAIGTMKNSTKEMNEYNNLLQDRLFKNSIYSESLSMFAVHLKDKEIVIHQKNGIYHNVIDVSYEDYLKDLIDLVYKDDKKRVKQFFDYQHIQDIYHKKQNDRIEYRMYDDISQDYKWIRYHIQFERESRHNELLMIAYCIDINDEKSQQLEIEYKAQRDGLTGLYNRQTFNQLVNEYLQSDHPITRYSSYIVADLDDFKSINDTLGHSVGDEVIQKVASILEDVCGPQSYIGRFGGDEFVIFLYDQESYAQIEEKARLILKTISEIQYPGCHEISSSLGITFVRDEKDNAELFEKSDQALYICKNNGKNSFYVYK